MIAQSRSVIQSRRMPEIVVPDMPAHPNRIRRRAVADAVCAGARFDQAAAALFADFSRGQLQKWIRSGELTLDGRTQKPTVRLSGGEVLEIDAAPAPDDRVEPERIALDVIHADADLVVLDKPAGLVVHPAVGNRTGTLQNALLHYDPSLAAVPRAGIVHRLDKDTSGVLVVARSLRAHASLVAQLQARTMSRIYEAVVWGDVATGGTVDLPVGRHPRDRKRMAVVASGKRAVTHYRVLQRYGAFTRLELSLETGRTHQIRVHMTHRRHPLVGDPQYGRRPRSPAGIDPVTLAQVVAFPRQALHARRLSLIHPEDGAERQFDSPLPEDFRSLLRQLEPDPA